jgi:hypothetical protein
LVRRDAGRSGVLLSFVPSVGVEPGWRTPGFSLDSGGYVQHPVGRRRFHLLDEDWRLRCHLWVDLDPLPGLRWASVADDECCDRCLDATCAAVSELEGRCDRLPASEFFGLPVCEWHQSGGWHFTRIGPRLIATLNR